MQISKSPIISSYEYPCSSNRTCYHDSEAINLCSYNVLSGEAVNINFAVFGVTRRAGAQTLTLEKIEKGNQ